MAKLFPLNTGVSEIRGIIEIIKDNGSSIEMSRLSEETNDDIDGLFPLIDTCSILGLCTIKKGIVKLTASGSKLASDNSRELFSRALMKVEPFKSALSLLAKSPKTTQSLCESLRKKGVAFHDDSITNKELIKDLLLKWGVTNRLFHYDSKADLWSKYKSSS
jgi:hypothetical protein